MFESNVTGGNESPSKKKKETVAENTVITRRLKQIERENRSIGSILDGRSLHALADIPPVGKSKIDSEKQELKKSTLLNANKITEPDPDEDDDKFAHTTGEFKEEEMIWKSKSRAPTYVIKRRFEDPSLHKFRATMSNNQKKKYTKKSKEAVMEISQSLREQLATVKNDMDDRGIFHPEANAQRVHCQYLLKLYRGISAETVEDPILRKMKDDERGGSLAKKDEITEEQQRKMKGVSSFVIKLSRKLNDSLAKTPAGAEQGHRGRANQHRATAAAAASAKLNATESSVTERNKSAPPREEAETISRKPSHMPGQTITSSPGHGQSPPGTANANASGGIKDMREREKDVNRFSRAASMDPRKVLVEEAERLDNAPRTQRKKVTDRVDFIEDEATTWMLSSVQNEQITQASGGYAFILPSWRSIPAIAEPLLTEEFSDEEGVVELFLKRHGGKARLDSSEDESIPASREFGQLRGSLTANPVQQEENRKTPSMSKDALPQPMEILSFEQFQSSFKEFVAKQVEQNQRSRISNAYSTKSSADKSQMHSPMEGATAQSSGSPMAADNVISNLQMNSMSSSSVISGSSKPMTEFQHSQSNIVPTNVLKVLSKNDDKFNDFLKMARSGGKYRRPHPSTQAKRHSSNKSDKDVVGRIRPVPLLGKKAVELGSLKDPRGGVRSIQGFQNVIGKKPDTETVTNTTPLTNIDSSDFAVKEEEEAGDIEVSISRNDKVDIKNTIASKGPILTDQDRDYTTGTRRSSEGSGSSVRFTRSPISPTLSASHSPSPSNQSPAASPSSNPRPASNVSDKSPSRKTSHRRNRRKEKRSEVFPNETGVSAVQLKLTDIWEMLQCSTNTKISFMRKYSDSINAGDLVFAMDRWGEVAALVAMRLGLQKVVVENQQGFIMGVLYFQDFCNTLLSSMPASFQATSSDLVPQNRLEDIESLLDYETLPRSAAAIELVQHFSKRIFTENMSTSAAGDGLCVNEIDVPKLLLKIVRRLDRTMLAAVKQTREALGDLIGYSDMTVREWLMILGAQMDHIESENFEEGTEELMKQMSTLPGKMTSNEGNQRSSIIRPGIEQISDLKTRHSSLQHLLVNHDLGELDSDSDRE